MKTNLLIGCLLLMASVVFGQYAVGDQAEDFKLMDVSGKKMSMSDFPDANGYIIIFTCNHCPYSVLYEDRIIAINKIYAPKGYPVIAINPNDPAVQPGDSFEAMQVRAKEKGFTFPYLFDDGQHVYPKYGATRTPHVFLLDKDKVVRYIGAIDNNHQDPAEVTEPFLESAINALMSGKTIDPNYTRAIGCTIKS